MTLYSKLEPAAGQGTAHPRDPADMPPVRVNGVEIAAAAIHQEAQNHPSPSPRAALDAAARALVIRELLLQEARRQGLAAAPRRDAAGRVQREEDALIDALIDSQVHTPQADEATCRRYYANNGARFRSPDLYEARHILIASSSGDIAARDAAKALAERIIAELEDDPSRFAELARAHSACPSRDQGGNLGQVSPGQTVPEFETFLANLEQGQLCPVPVATRFGFHVVRLDRRIAGRPLDFDAVRPKIAAYLEAASWSRAVAQYVSLLAGAARIEGIDLGGADSPLVQ